MWNPSRNVIFHPRRCLETGHGHPSFIHQHKKPVCQSRDNRDGLLTNGEQEQSFLFIMLDLNTDKIHISYRNT